MPNRAPDLSSGLAQCSDYASLEQMLFKSVAGKLGAETGVLLQFRQRRRGYEFSRNTPSGVSPKAHNRYISKFHRADPVLVQGRQVSRPSRESDATTNVFRLSDVCDEASFTQTQYYNDFLKPAGIRHVLALAVRPQSENNDLLVVIGFHRPLGSRDFDDKALQSAVKLAPVVASTIARLTFKENMHRYRALADDMQLLVQESSFILMDDQLEIQRTNLHAAIFDSEEFAGLLAQIRSVCVKLLVTCQKQTSFAYDSGNARKTAFENKISVEVNMLTSHVGKPRFVVQLSSSRTNVAITQCARHFSWTDRESEIVMAVAQGLSNPQIASYLNISIRTVENHLRAVYSKAEVTSRTQLLRHLLHYTPAHQLITDGGLS